MVCAQWTGEVKCEVTLGRTFGILKGSRKSMSTFCQAQGPTLGPTKGQVKVKVKVRTWSGHGQVRSGQVKLRLQLQLKSGT